MLAANKGLNMTELISAEDTRNALPQVLVSAFDVKTSEVKTPKAAPAAIQVSDSMASAFTFNPHFANLQAARAQAQAQAQMMAHSAQLAAASSMGATAASHDTMAAVTSAGTAGFQLPPAAAYPFNPAAAIAMQRSLSGVVNMTPMPDFSLGVGGPAQVPLGGVGIGGIGAIAGSVGFEGVGPGGLGKAKKEGRGLEGAEEEGQMAMKRPRLIWTKQLHERFVEAVNKMGVDQAVPKAIMQSMNVKGITRENVASHLQKYRAQLKKNKTAAAAAAENGTKEEEAAAAAPAPDNGSKKGAEQEEKEKENAK